MRATMRHFPPTTCPGKTSGGCSGFCVVLIRSTSVSPNGFPSFRRARGPTDTALSSDQTPASQASEVFRDLPMAARWLSYGHAHRAKQQLPPLALRRRDEAPQVARGARGAERVRLPAPAHPAPGRHAPRAVALGAAFG